jgi:hypothetical protein
VKLSEVDPRTWIPYNERLRLAFTKREPAPIVEPANDNAAAAPATTPTPTEGSAA